MNRVNLKDLITVSNMRSNSDGIDDWKYFQLIFPCMVVEIRQFIPKNTQEPKHSFKYIESVREKAIASMKWWRRMFPTPLNVTGLCISCYIPQHRKNGY